MSKTKKMLIIVILFAIGITIVFWERLWELFKNHPEIFQL